MTRARIVVLLVHASLAAIAAYPVPAVAQPKPDSDAAGCKDHPLFTRMQNMRIATCRSSDFASFAFRTGKGQTTPVEGKRFEIRYQIIAGNQAPSPLASIRNHQQATKAIGGAVVYEDPRYTTLKVSKEGKEIWTEVDTAWGGGFVLTIVEKQAMVQEVTANADMFKSGLQATGHVEVPGIFFDTGKAELKPESAAAVAEVAKLLKADAALKVYVVGHTDNVASLDLNLKLSQARADSVVQALVSQHGIAAVRLAGRGVGPLAPVASNDNEDGRARNRRVELVKQ
jgi:outer membrane protein OmpA-like peptidoglycan-associated protein